MKIILDERSPICEVQDMLRSCVRSWERDLTYDKVLRTGRPERSLSDHLHKHIDFRHLAVAVHTVEHWRGGDNPCLQLDLQIDITVLPPRGADVEHWVRTPITFTDEVSVRPS